MLQYERQGQVIRSPSKSILYKILGFSFFHLTVNEFLLFLYSEFVVRIIFTVTTVQLQWLEHLWNHVNMFETGVVRADECKSDQVAL